MMLMNVMMGIITMQMVLLLLMLMLMLIMMMMMMMTNPRVILSIIYKPNKLYLCRRLAPLTPPPPILQETESGLILQILFKITYLTFLSQFSLVCYIFASLWLGRRVGIMKACLHGITTRKINLK